MPREFPSSPFKASASPEKAPKKSKFKVPGMVKALGLAAGLHAAAYATPDVVERVEQYQEEARREENRERIERNRAEAVRRALAEIEAGDLHFWEFIRDTDRADMEAAEMPVPSASEVERNFNEVTERLLEQQQGYHEVHNDEDREYLQESLRVAFEGYYYTAGMGEADIQTFFHERGGPCEMISLAIVSALDRAGYEGVGIRYYPPDEAGIGHAAPSLTFTDDGGVVHEIDLVGGGAVVPGGVTLPLDEVVREYASQHGLLPREGAVPVSDQAGESVSRGWSLSVPMPAEARPFAGNAPFYSAEIFGAYRTDEQGNVIEDGELSPGVSTEDLRLEEHANVQDAERFVERAFERVVTYGSDRSGAGSEIYTRSALSEAEWVRLSELLGWVEQGLEAEGLAPYERLSRLGAAVGLYRLASLESAFLPRRQLHQFAEHRIARYQAEAAPILEAHMEDHAFFFDGLTQVAEGNVGFEIGLSVLGEQGGRMLVNYYDLISAEYEAELMGASARALTYILLVPETCDAGLERAARLHISQQFLLARSLSFIALSNPEHSHTAEDHPIFMGSDPFSRNYRAYEALFEQRHLDERLAGGHIEAVYPEIDGHSTYPFEPSHESREAFTPDPSIRINHFSEVMDEIHRYAETHGFDAAWEQEVRVFAALNLTERIRNFGLWHHWRLFQRIQAEQRPLLVEIAQWMRSIPNQQMQTEANELEEFIRHSRRIDGD